MCRKEVRAVCTKQVCGRQGKRAGIDYNLIGGPDSKYHVESRSTGPRGPSCELVGLPEKVKTGVGHQAINGRRECLRK